MQKMFNLILIGETGTGKSSFGNFALGIENGFEVSDDPESCTKDTIRKISQIDPEISIVDTPGLQDSKGRDRIHYEKMLKIIKQMESLHFILIVLNFTCPRLTSSLKYMIKFLCNVFPKNFAHHIGIVFTHYDHDYQMKINKNKSDPREKRKKLIKETMELISQTTNEELFLGPPVYYLDSYIDDNNSKEELNRLIAFAKTLKPIENIRENCDLKYKKVEDIIKVEENEMIEGDYIVTYIKKFCKKKYTDYNDNVSYGKEELLSTDKRYRSAPVREKIKYITTDIKDKEDEKNKEEKNKEEKNKDDEKNDKQKKKEICRKFVEGGILGVVGSAALTIGGVLLTPVCPILGPGMIYAGLAGEGTSVIAEYGGIIADKIIDENN